ncbi:protein kinase domain-containing protein [Lusitaniella coriacea]|uniref:protein kinase domain-containing protein n=1 Tax=Lusitaniella coriacea TaxID=1983105 RepID=UPI003CE77A76
MSYCLNPQCLTPKNPTDANFCLVCGTSLSLKDRYRAVKPIGQGGFGRTFLAIDEDKPSKPFCVIKQFFPKTKGSHQLAKAAEMFEREAIRLDQLGEHPQIPALYAYFSVDDRQYLVQEYIDGQNLEQEISTYGAFNEAQILVLLEELLLILQFVHQERVIHRDIKPENIICRNLTENGQNQLYLVDFGAAKTVIEQASDRAGTAIGSTGYVAPEQAIGRATYASDLYSLGVTCAYLLTGIHPFSLFNPQEGEWDWRDRVSIPVRDRLVQILDKMLAIPLNLRYQSATEVLKDLENLVAQPTSRNLDAEIEQLKRRFSRQHQHHSHYQPTQPLAAPPSNSIDLELEELEAKFLDVNKQQSTD